MSKSKTYLVQTYIDGYSNYHIECGVYIIRTTSMKKAREIWYNNIGVMYDEFDKETGRKCIGIEKIKRVKLIRDDDDILSSTFIPFNKVQAVKIEIHKTDSGGLLRQMIGSGLDLKKQTEQTPPLSNESKQSYT